MFGLLVGLKGMLRPHGSRQIKILSFKQKEPMNASDVRDRLIMVVDDNADDRRLQTDFLRAQGSACTRPKTGWTGWKRRASCCPT